MCKDAGEMKNHVKDVLYHFKRNKKLIQNEIYIS